MADCYFELCINVLNCNILLLIICLMKKIYVHFCNIAIHSNAIYNMTLTRIVYVLLNLFRCVAHTGEIMVLNFMLISLSALWI